MSESYDHAHPPCCYNTQSGLHVTTDLYRNEIFRLTQDQRMGNKRDGIHQERDGEDGHGQKTVAFFGRWPILPASKQAPVSKATFDFISYQI